MTSAMFIISWQITRRLMTRSTEATTAFYVLQMLSIQALSSFAEVCMALHMNLDTCHFTHTIVYCTCSTLLKKLVLVCRVYVAQMRLQVLVLLLFILNFFLQMVHTSTQYFFICT